VHLIQVDVVGAEPPQRILDRGHDPASRATAMVGVIVERHEEFGGDYDVVAAALQCLADELLRLALRVHVGGVDEVDPCVEGPLDDADAFVVVLGAPVAEHHGAKAQVADRDAGTPERTVFH
jgi:hypothetical protein